MFKTRRRKLECDILEERALLSGVTGLVPAQADVAPAHAAVKSAHAAARTARLNAKHMHASIRSARAAIRSADALMAAQQATPLAGTAATGTTGSITGGGLVTVGPPPTSQETDLFQQVAIANNAVAFLTQLEILKGTTSNLQQASMSVLNDARNLDLLAYNTANSLGVSLPADLIGNVKTTVMQAVTAVNGGQFEKAYATALSSVGSTMVSQLQMMEGSNINASLRTFATTALPIVQTDIAALQTVANGGTSTLPTVSTSPSSSTLSSTDLNTLATSYSTATTERFLGQLTALTSNNLQIRLYGEKLISDHEMQALQISSYAAATGTFLPASITSSADLSAAMKVLNAVPTSSGGGTTSYDQTYLMGAVSGHIADMTANENTVNTTTNAVLKQFAISDLPTDLMHLNAAIYLMQQELGSTGTGTGTGTGSTAVAHVGRSASA